MLWKRLEGFVERDEVLILCSSKEAGTNGILSV